MRILMVAISAATLGGCATQSAAPPVPVNLAEASFAKALGKATVKGQMFLKRKDGVVVYGAGNDAQLVPKTGHSEQVLAASFPAGKLRYHVIFGVSSGSALAFDPSFEPYIRATKADGQGNFSFRDVPPGSYFVIGNVTWCIMVYGSCNRQGGDVYETVTVRPGDNEVAAMLSGT